MAKEEFVQSVDAPGKMAEKAWKVASGDEDQARELLEVANLWFKGVFISSSDPVCGFFLVGMDTDEDSVHTVKGVVLNSDQEQDVETSMGRSKFANSLDYLANSDKKMNANTEQLVDVLSDQWKDSESDIRKAVVSGEFGGLSALHTESLNREFDFKIGETTVDTESERAVEGKQEPASQQEEETEDVELPCDVEVTPVQGVPVAKLSPGDDLFVEIGDVDASDRNVKRRLEATKSQETGMVPARLVSKGSSDAGTMNLRVQFAENIYGKVACGMDVSLRVPENTLQRYSGSGSDDTLELIKENWIVATTGVIVAVLLISLILVLLGIF